MRQIVVGLTLLVVSVTAAAVNLWAQAAFPARWGGPNIGAGMLQLLFYTGALGGAAYAVMGFVKARRNRI
jgi:hypothetical protein